MNRLLFVPLILLLQPVAFSQKADFQAAEKFRAENLIPRYGDLSLNANWIEESDIFWYSFKTPAGKNYYYVNAASRSRKLLFDSRIEGIC